MVEHAVSSVDKSYDLVVSFLEPGEEDPEKPPARKRIVLWSVSCKGCGAERRAVGDDVAMARSDAWHQFLRTFPWDCRESLVLVTMSR